MGSKASTNFSAMSDDEIVAEVATLIRKCVPEFDESIDISIDTKLAEDLGIDSLGGYELIMEAEDHFGVEINDSQLEGIKTVGALIAVVRSNNV